MKKKILAAVLSCSMLLVMPMQANATSFGMYNDSEKYEEFMKGLTLVDDHGLFVDYAGNESPYALYATDVPHMPNYYFYATEYQAHLRFETFSDVSDETVTGVLDRYFPEYFLSGAEAEAENISEWFVAVDHYADISQDKYREMVAELNESAGLISFDYRELVDFLGITCDIGCYGRNYNIIADMIDEYELDCTIEKHIEADNYNYTWIVPNKEEYTLSDQFALAALIREKTGVKPIAQSPASDNKRYYSISIDMLNAIDGDANNDGELSMADAVYIMQSIANPDKYQLTAQGSFNADIANTGDGITVKDALVVQQRLLGLE